ncbi:heterokaryon incompatibility protein [Fusarium sp. NRRL 52700]|nr:heterokaryon incompatibility protein [Fusarium sp. NRRL 52700]
MAYITLCSTCTRALHFDQVSWEEERRNSSMWPMRLHHESLESFRRASLQNCYICCRVWDMLVSGKVTSVESEPTWKEGSEADWDGMHYMAQYDHDSPAILFMICCPGSKEHSHYIPFELMPKNDSHQDWERESACMGLVYSNGLCNIAASASDGPDGGLFRSRNAESIRLGCVRANPLPGTRSQTFNIIDTLYTERQLRYTPFFERGWVFQERMLAPRVIYFAEEQVFWECHQELKCEAFPTGIPFAGSFKALLPERLTNLLAWSRGKCVSCTVFRQWNRVVQGYSDSQFTFTSDKLPAFMGIAKYFEPFIDADYAFGMWSAGLDKQLGFSVDAPVMKQSRAYRAPSWSWASLDGPVLFTELLSEEIPKTFVHVQFGQDGLRVIRLRLWTALFWSRFFVPGL